MMVQLGRPYETYHQTHQDALGLIFMSEVDKYGTNTN
jgi:hypothetical protein